MTNMEDPKPDIEMVSDLEIFSRILQRCSEHSVDLKQIWNDFYHEAIPVDVLQSKFWEIVAVSDPVQALVTDELSNILGEPLLSKNDAVMLKEEHQSFLDTLGLDLDSMVYRPFEDRPHYLMLHPLMQTAILERAQFDGDVVEWRSGDLPKDGTPAVPIKAMSRDPVAIGSMLRKAAKEVAQELQENASNTLQKHTRIVQTLVRAGAPTTMISQIPIQAASTEGYTPGQKAAMRTVEPPSSLEIASLSFRDKQSLSYKTLTSTQGRQSIAPVLQKSLLENLHKDGYTHLRGEGKTPQDIQFAESTWTILVDGKSGDFNPRFNFIENALTKLTKDLKKKLSFETEGVLQVQPFANIQERMFGWIAIVFAHPKKELV